MIIETPSVEEQNKDLLKHIRFSRGISRLCLQIQNLEYRQVGTSPMPPKALLMRLEELNNRINTLVAVNQINLSKRTESDLSIEHSFKRTLGIKSQSLTLVEFYHEPRPTFEKEHAFHILQAQLSMKAIKCIDEVVACSLKPNEHTLNNIYQRCSEFAIQTAVFIKTLWPQWRP